MHIGIDISRTLGNPTGVGWYTAHLVDAFRSIDVENEYSLYPFFWHCHPNDYRNALRFSGRNFTVRDTDRNFPELAKRWSENTLSAEQLLGPIDILHCPAYTAPDVSHCRLIVTIHDMSFLTHPHFHTDENRRFCMIQTLRASRFADAIICVSEATARDVQRYLHINEDRLFVIPEAAGEEFRRIDDQAVIMKTLIDYGIQENFILYVGTVEPRKNLSTLIEAYARLRKSTSYNEWLVIAGGSGWKNEDIYKRVEELGLTSYVKFLGYVSSDALVALYNSCRVFVYPSLYEGFGLPVLEAMACGAPVITSSVSSLPEVAGDAAIAVDPQHIDSLTDSIYSILSDDTMRMELRRKGLYRASRFSWEETARKTLALYARVFAG